MNTLTVPSTFQNNAIFILDCLGSSDLPTGRHLFEALDALPQTTLKPLIQYWKLQNPAELYFALEWIKAACRQIGVKPIIHFEAHAGANAGIGIGDQQHLVSWLDLARRLREINIETRNNLGVVMAACFCLYAIESIRITEPTPFYFLIGSEQLVSAPYLDMRMEQFYLELCKTGSLNQAMTKVDDQFKQFHAERMFYVGFGRYLRAGCMGEGRQHRIERLMSEIKRARNRKQRRRVAKSAAEMTRPSPRVFRKYANLFLHSRVTVSYSEFLAFIKRGAKK